MYVLFWNESVETFFQVINNNDYGEVLITEENNEETTLKPTDQKVYLRYLEILYFSILF